MSKYASIIVNDIIDKTPGGIDKIKYLEVGTDSWGHTFWKIKCKQKTGVDIIDKSILMNHPEIGPRGGRNMAYHDDYYGNGSDAFFEEILSGWPPWKKRTWDVVFIDGDHKADQVLKDYNNSVRCGAKVILVHDLIPPEERLAGNSPDDRGAFCGDGFRFLYWLRDNNLAPLSMNDDFGLSLFVGPKIVSSDAIADVDYSEFQKQRLCFPEYSLGDTMKEVCNIPERAGWK